MGVVTYYLFQSWCREWCSIWICICSETVLSFLCAWLAKKYIPLPVKFLSGALPTFGVGWFGWLCYSTLDLELFSVVSGKFLKTPAALRSALWALVQLFKCKQFFHLREAELQGSTGVFAVFQEGWIFQLFCLWSGTVNRGFPHPQLKRMYLTFSLWKGPDVWSNSLWINLYLLLWFLSTK